MYFDTLEAALAMDGHGSYVWSAYAVTAFVICCLLLLPIMRRRRLIRELRGEYRRNRQATAGSPVELP